MNRAEIKRKGGTVRKEARARTPAREHEKARKLIWCSFLEVEEKAYFLKVFL